MECAKVTKNIFSQIILKKMQKIFHNGFPGFSICIWWECLGRAHKKTSYCQGVLHEVKIHEKQEAH